MNKKAIIPVLCLLSFAAASIQGGGLPSGSFSGLIGEKGGFSQEESIAIAVQLLDKDESEKFLKRDLNKWGYRPIRITIDNRSPDPYLLNPSSMGLPTASASKVARLVMKESLPQTLGLQAAGLVFWPISFVGAMNGLKTMKTYNAVKKTLSSKSVKKEIIAPFSLVNRILLVPEEDFKDSFEIRLENQETLETKTFRVEGLTEESSTKEIRPIVVPVENYYLNRE